MKTFPRCLDSVLRQSTQSKEIIVVDRFSQDGLASFAQTNGATVIQSSANRSRARNIGLQNAISKGVLFVDADMILPPTLIEECEIGLDEFWALIIPEKSIGVGYWAECKTIERAMRIGDERMEAARCFRRASLTSLGGYRASLESGEDWDLHNRAAASSINIGRTRSVIQHDEGHLSLLVLLRKKHRYGKSFGRYLRLNPGVAYTQVNPLRRIVRPSLKTFLFAPKYGIGILTMTSLEFAAAGLGHVVGQIGLSAS